MNPEMPFLLGGGVILAGGVAREKSIPKNTVPALMGTAALVVVASMTAGTVAAPLVRAIGLLYLLACVIASVKLAKGIK